MCIRLFGVEQVPIEVYEGFCELSKEHSYGVMLRLQLVFNHAESKGEARQFSRSLITFGTLRMLLICLLNLVFEVLEKAW